MAVQKLIDEKEKSFERQTSCWHDWRNYVRSSKLEMITLMENWKIKFTLIDLLDHLVTDF